MKQYLCALLLSAATSVFAAAPGPQSNFDKNTVWAHPDMNAINPTGLTTRGILYFNTSNNIGAVDRLSQAIADAHGAHQISDSRYALMTHVLSTARVLGNYPLACTQVETWLAENPASPFRADMQLLLADLLLEKGQTADALEKYNQIDINTLSPDLQADCLYHRAYANLALARNNEARELFASPKLLNSSIYGNGARFYLGYICYVERDYNNALSRWENVNTDIMPGMAADYYRSQIAYLRGNYAEAMRLARPLTTKTNVDPLYIAEANRIMGESLYQTGQSSQAIPYLNKYVAEVETPERSTLYILGVAQYDNGRYEDAVKSLTPVTTDQSAMGQSAYLYIGQALLNTGDVDAAILAFNRALNMDFDSNITEAAYYNYAVAKSRGAGVPFGSSVGIFEEFLSRFPDSRYANDVASYLVEGYVTDDNYEAALASVNKVRNPSPAVLAAKQKLLYMQGARLLSADRLADAVNLLSQAKAMKAYDANIANESELLLGEALYQAGRYNDAAVSFINYINTADASGNNVTNRPVALYDLAYTRMAQKNWPDAQANFEKLLQNPGNLDNAALADARTRLADALYYQRNWSAAAAAYDKAYNQNPATGDYPLLQKAIMQGYNRDYNGKMQTLDRMMSEFPESNLMPDALMQQAETYIQLGQGANADAIYRNVIAKYASTAQGRRAYLYLAAHQAADGETEKAIRTYQSLIQDAPTSDEAHQADEALRRIHAERGTLAQYSDFLDTTGAPAMTADETETLSWNAAEHAYLGGKGVTLLEKYVADYPAGKYTAAALSYLLDNADRNDNDTDAYRWATMLINNYPDNVASENALYIKADIDYDQGRGGDALRQWEQLEQKASTPEYVDAARMGILRVARDLGDTKRMRSTAALLRASTALDPEDRSEVDFTVALAAHLEGDNRTAIAGWKALADNPDDIYGAKAAVYATDALNETRQYDEAAKVAEAFVNSDTPHTYWLARGFIALSDAYNGLGRNFEAREYLNAIKENYPGEETDIFEMIEERTK